MGISIKKDRTLMSAASLTGRKYVQTKEDETPERNVTLAQNC